MTPSVTDLVERNFTRHARDQLWVTDITEHPTFEGKVHCAVVLDTFSRRVVGWSIDASPTAALTTNALTMTIGNRSPSPGSTIIHSDHGVQFGSWAFTERARASGLRPDRQPGRRLLVPAEHRPLLRERHRAAQAISQVRGRAGET
ncbi:DDE-type integrase/transposase/recombinase [Streptomyces collinus]|uniref:DDE-type integrase/transposase/recombinase n=1 Tax=Streptomyces collinus TaxID=42684 RepID=UPI003821C3BD